MDEQGATEHEHFTARRGFIAAAGFGLVSVYFLWAGYGAAPLGLGGAHETPDSDGQGHAPEPSAAGHGGHGGDAAGPSREQFRKLTEEFIERYKLADGSVRPAGAQADHGAHAMHGAAAQMPSAPIDVYLMAYQWGYAPSVLRLEAGVPYRFRMMAVDVAHGASLRLGPGGRIVRLRPGALAEQELTFTQPGEYLLYCTVYCGLAHDRMQGRVIVTSREA